MTCYRMRIAFNGSRFSGWQRQTGLRTVQQSAEETLRPVFRDPDLKVSACSRTDAGVHALDMTLSFRTETDLPDEELAALLKRRLPHDIRLIEAVHAAARFDACRDALGKAYVYVIRPGEPDIFLKDLCWNWPEGVSPQTCLPMIERLPGTHDFRFFTGRHVEQDTVRTIFRAELIRFGSLYCLYISGNGFLYKMVRRLAGFLYEAARGEHSAEEFVRLLEKPGPPADDVTVAPPEGLYLKKAFYEPGEWQADTLTGVPFLNFL